MFILNTTFSIHKQIIEKALKYILTEYIPNLQDDGFISPVLLRIYNNEIESDGYVNYAIQVQAHSLNFVSNWKENEETEYANEIRSLFGENILSFSTIMETVEL